MHLLEGFEMPDLWDVVRVLRNGREELVATGITLGEASSLADRILKQRRPGETVSLREAVVFSSTA